MCPRGYVITKISAELLLYNNNDNNNNDDNDNDNDNDDAAVDDAQEAVTADDVANEDLPYQFQKTENYDNGATTEADDDDFFCNGWTDVGRSCVSRSHIRLWNEIKNYNLITEQRFKKLRIN